MSTETANTATKTDSDKVAAMIKYIRQTRRYGRTYVHAWVREGGFRYAGVYGRIGDHLVKMVWSGYGRSLEVGGRKYKVHAYYIETGKPVRSKDLSKIQAT